MGRAKAEMMRQEDLLNQAMGVAVEAGAVSECPVHDGIYLSEDDPDAEKRAYAIGTNKVKAGEVGGSREDFMAAIKTAMQSAGEECPICAKNRDRD